MPISIIIPHLNQPQNLAGCLSALARQVDLVAGSEVIVVDNGSRELPQSICNAYGWCQLISEAAKGPGPARNKGILQAKCGVLAFIDADCLPHPDWLANIDRALRDNPGWQIIGGDVRILRGSAGRATALEAYESVFAYRQKEYIEKMGFSGTGNLAMRRTAYETVGPFAGIAIAEDRDWGRRASAKGVSIQYVADVIVFHPARRNIAELRQKWDRHVAHDYAELSPGLGGKLYWAARSMAVLASAVIDVRLPLFSRRISGWRERVLAAQTLMSIRVYRAGRMLGNLTRPANSPSSWNRS